MKYNKGAGAPESLPSCIFVKGGGVLCGGGNCTSCGWNPAVSEERLRKIMKKMEDDRKAKNGEPAPVTQPKPLDVYAVRFDLDDKPIIMKNGSYYMTARSKSAAESIVAMLNADAARTV